MKTPSSTYSRCSRAGFSASRLLACGIVALQCLLAPSVTHAGNSIVGDGFGGRKWYKPSTLEIAGNGYVGACVVSGQLWLWGNQSGDQTFPNFQGAHVNEGSWPFAVSGMTNVASVSMGWYAHGVVKNDGTCWVWGIPSGSLLSNTPTQVLTNVKQCSAGNYFISMVKNDGTVWSIGKNYHGSFGAGSQVGGSSATVPVQMTGVTDAVRVEAFGEPTTSPQQATVVLHANGKVSIAGGYAYLQPNVTPTYTPTLISGLTNIVQIKCTGGTLMALDSSGDVWTMGSNAGGMLGQGIVSLTATSFTPAKVTFPTAAADIVAISGNNVNGGISYAIDANGKLWAWGQVQGLFGTAITGGTVYGPPILCANHVADVVTGGSANYQNSYLVRDNSYPSDDRVWYAARGASNQTLGLSTLNARTGNGVPLSGADTGLVTNLSLNVWTVCDIVGMGIGGVANLGTGSGVNAINETITTPYLTAVSGNLATGNTVPSGAVFAIVTQPTNGTVSGLNTSTGAYTYTPNASFSGTDTFTYSITAGGFTATATVTATVGSAPPTTDLAITKAASVTQVVPGAPFNYTLNITNTGAAATNVTANDTVPAGLTIQGTPTASNSGVVTVTGQNVKVVWPTMASGASNTVTINVVK